MPDGGGGLGQREYWDANLDPDNLGRRPRGTASARNDDYWFYMTPDQRDALAALGEPAGRRILDIGAGLGFNARYLAARGARVVAADIAGERLARLRAAAPSDAALDCVVCRAEALPFRRGAFDGVYSKSVLIHTRLAEAAPELARVTGCEGVGVFIEPLARNPLANLYRRTLGPKEWQTITRYFDDDSIARVREAYGRADVRHYYLLSFLAFGFQFAVRAPRLFRAALAVAHGFDAWLLRLLPVLRRYAWFVVIEAQHPDRPGHARPVSRP
ncbi:MAG: class I SAM-dependent methyltransferase [Candidatus Sumerlaeaceae bacterium]|nr:class I SAM-dependent methyltransferase [Candidatus Sumerlaeaceae bacterium]